MFDVDTLRKHRNTGHTMYARFCTEHTNNDSCLFCFFEGEDYKYYVKRIETYTNYKFNSIIKYNCGGKKEVLKALELFMNDHKLAESYHKNIAFFVDKDFDDDVHYNELLYQTPCYSIENFYTSLEVFEQILQVEFGINSNESDFCKALHDFSSRQSEFHKYMLYVNSWLACQHLHKVHVCYSNFKITKLFSEISIDKVVCNRIINKEKLGKLFNIQNEISDTEIQLKSDYFTLNGMGSLFRGKFEIEFLKRVLFSLIDRNKNNQYFTTKRTAVKLSSDNNMLSTFQSYAVTPDCLKNFLKKYK